MWGKHVGRVGALAVALGIGSAVVAMPGVAWAQPDGAGSASSSDGSAGGSPGRTKTADRPSRSAGDTAKSDDTGESDESDKSEAPAESDDATEADDATDSDDAVDSDDAAEPDDAPEPDDGAEPDISESEEGPTPDTEQSPRRGSGNKRTSDTGTPAATAEPDDDDPVDAQDAVQESPSAPADQNETTSPITGDHSVDAPAAAPPAQTQATPSTSAPVETVTERPATPTLATVLTSLFSPQVSSNAVDQPEVPGASPLLWTLLAYARRDFERTPEAGSVGVTTSSAQAGDVQASATSPAIPGQAYQSPVIADDGTIYQLISEGDGTRVVVLDSNGQILNSANIGGSTVTFVDPVARPDGTLIVVTTNERRSRSTISAVDSQGAVTTVATVTGYPDGPVTVSANGALYFTTDVRNIFDPLGDGIDYRFVRVSPTDTVRSFAYDTTVELTADGTAHLVSSQWGFSTLRVIPPTGFTRTIPLPYGSDPTAPILGQDGTVYVTAGVRSLFGTKTTRVYTVTGASTAVRTIAGLPGRTVVGADGLHLETFTYPGFTDNGTGTTYISRLTATTITTSTAIDGRIGDLQATPDGTVYAPINDAALTTTPVKVVDRNGNVTTVTLPGRLVLPPTAGPGVVRVSGGGTQSADDLGYISYSANGTTFVAVLNPDATVARAIELPEGARNPTVVFGPDGAAYAVIEYLTDGQLSKQILALSTGTFTPVVPGTSYFNAVDIQFGPDGTGYLITDAGGAVNYEIQVLGFNAAGATVATATGLINATVDRVGKDFFDAEALVFSPDGTAYLTIYSPGQAGVYALTPAGAQEVVDIEYTDFFGNLSTPTFNADGTIGFVQTSARGDSGFFATVVTFTPATGL